MIRRAFSVLAVLVSAVPTAITSHPHSAPLVPAPSTHARVLVGARAGDKPFTAIGTETGPIKVTRLFYSGSLPRTFSRQGIPAGVKLIVSYKSPTTNVTEYVRSIPADQDVELCWHHEPEADFPSGRTFTTVFDQQADLSHRANPRVPFAFIAGMYAYRQGGPGWSGTFVPTKQDRSYSDSYLPTARAITPAATEPRLTRYRSLLAARNRTWDGFTEYGRGVVRKGAAFDPVVAAARAAVIRADAAWIRTTTARVWAYWFTTDVASGDQWRFGDAASLAAWRQAALTL